MQQPLVGGGALAHRLRRVGIVEHLLEDALGLVVIVVEQRVEAVPFLRREAESAIGRHQRPERALELLAVAVFENDQRGAQQGDLLGELVDAGVLADGVELLQRLGLVGAGLGGADARQRGVALGAVLGEGVKGGGRFGALSFVGERDSGDIAVIGGFGGLLTLVLIVAPGAGRGHDQKGDDENRRLIPPPEFGGLVPADVFIDLVENVRHFSRDPSVSSPGVVPGFSCPFAGGLGVSTARRERREGAWAALAAKPKG